MPSQKKRYTLDIFRQFCLPLFFYEFQKGHPNFPQVRQWFQCQHWRYHQYKEGASSQQGEWFKLCQSTQYLYYVIDSDTLR